MDLREQCKVNKGITGKTQKWHKSHKIDTISTFLPLTKHKNEN